MIELFILFSHFYLSVMMDRHALFLLLSSSSFSFIYLTLCNNSSVLLCSNLNFASVSTCNARTNFYFLYIY